MEFEAVIEPARPGGTGGGAVVRLPDEVAAAFGTRRQVRVRGTVDGVAYRGNLMPTGGGAFCLGVHKATREAARRTFGDTVRVTVERDDEPREVDVPPDLQAALDADPAARAAFDRLAPSHRREHADAVAGAKRPETRARRVEKTLEMLRAKGQ
ncbi:MAG TPA: YdeI/OmpD-associated family protein [Mycobacteriales bacterium]|nr:YdeI/OmpD-associated family protein [Mycobacteriales bacterium]